jgi:hypothetical protein
MKETVLGMLPNGQEFIFGHVTFVAGSIERSEGPEEWRCCNIGNTRCVVYISTAAWVSYLE